MIYWRIAKVVAPYALGVAIVWYVLSTVYTMGEVHERTRQVAIIADLDRSHREQLQALTDAARATEQRYAAEMSALDHIYNEELNDAKRQTESAVAAVRAGELRLRDRFTCPAATSDGVPAADAGTRVGDAAGAGGLQREDADFLIRLAGEADALVVQLRACQAIVASDRADAQ